MTNWPGEEPHAGPEEDGLPPEAEDDEPGELSEELEE